MFCTNSLSQFYEICTKGDIMTFWERFYNLCIENNTKPNPLASKLGIASGTISGWKSGKKPNTNHLEQLCAYFNVSADYLLGKTDKKNEQTVTNELPASEELQKLIEASSTLSDEEARKAREYVELLKLKRNQESS